MEVLTQKYSLKVTVVAAQKCEVSAVYSEIPPGHRALGEAERNFTLFCTAWDFK